jgi:uncharacterized protein (TIGR02996 family)
MTTGEAFEAHLAANPGDHVARGAYADFLQDNDRDAEAHAHRAVAAGIIDENVPNIRHVAQAATEIANQLTRRAKPWRRVDDRSLAASFSEEATNYARQALAGTSSVHYGHHYGASESHSTVAHVHGMGWYTRHKHEAHALARHAHRIAQKLHEAAAKQVQ